MAYVPISGRLQPTSREKIAAETQYLFDNVQQKTQEQINSELLERKPVVWE